MRFPGALLLAATLLSPAASAQITLLGAGGNPGPVGPTTFDPTHLGTGLVLSGGNLVVTYTAGGSSYPTARSIASHAIGKYYAEFTLTSEGLGNAAHFTVGFVNGSFVGANLGADLNSGGIYGTATQLFINNVGSGTTPTFSATKVVGMAFDAGANLIWFRVNGGSWNAGGAADPATGTGGISTSSVTGPFFAAVGIATTAVGGMFTANFGGTAYGTATPSGYGNW